MQVSDKNTGTLKALQIIHRAMLLGMILFAAIAFFLNYSGNFSPALQQYDQVLQVIAIALSLGGFFTGNALFKKKIFELRASGNDLDNKLSSYRSASLSQWALLEGPALFAIICFLLVGNYAFLALAGALMILFAINTPTKIKMAMLLQINEEDIN
jgi:hypothetical protein